MRHSSNYLLSRFRNRHSKMRHDDLRQGIMEMLTRSRSKCGLKPSNRNLLRR